MFENQGDLLSEFGQFLPDATASFGASFMGPPPTKKPALSSSGGGKGSKPIHSRKASQVTGRGVWYMYVDTFIPAMVYFVHVYTGA